MTPKITPETSSAAPVNGDAAAAPFWSVMIPAYRPQETDLREALKSILAQDPGPAQMQIEVVDDCSPEVDVAACVKSIGGGRIGFSRTQENLGLAGCWNTCIERSRGQWVHLLHQDDYVLPGFYLKLAQTAAEYQNACLLATRSFYLDNDGVITGVTQRLKSLENGGRAVDDFFYGTPIQCPGVVVRRDFYERHGGFRTDLRFVLDCEMWTRAIASGGGVVVPDVLSCYRSSNENESSRLRRNAENLRDHLQLHRIFTSRHPEFDQWRSFKLLAHLASIQMEQFRMRGDAEALAANLAFWHREIPLKLRWRHRLLRLGRFLLG